MAEAGLKGVRFYRDHWQDIDAVILDMMMPDIKGAECIKEMKKINSGARIILTTGNSQESLAEKFMQDQIQGLLK